MKRAILSAATSEKRAMLPAMRQGRGPREMITLKQNLAYESPKDFFEDEKRVISSFAGCSR